jgi:hypothetical protein
MHFLDLLFDLIGTYITRPAKADSAKLPQKPHWRENQENERRNVLLTCDRKAPKDDDNNRGKGAG